MNSVTFSIPRITQSLNKHLRLHWRERHKLKDTWGWEVKVATFDHDIPPAKTLEFRRVKIASYRNSFLDPDNLYGGVKILVDRLVEQGLLYDDRQSCLDLTVTQEHVKKRNEQRTEITLMWSEDAS
jgi:hypothetical protein